MPRKKIGDKELEFLRSAWEILQTLERESKRDVTLTVTPTVQRGVFYFRLQATMKEPPVAEVHGSSAIGMRYPSGSSTSLAGHLFWMALKLEDLIASEEEAPQAVEKFGG